jgi:hypothetical protein
MMIWFYIDSVVYINFLKRLDFEVSVFQFSVSNGDLVIECISSSRPKEELRCQYFVNSLKNLIK